MEEETERAVVVPLIERATNSTAADVDPRLLKAIKSSVRSSDSELRCAAQTLLSLMKRDHSQAIFASLVILQSKSSIVEGTDPQNHSVEMTPHVDSDKAEQLVKQAVQNVRERDREEAKKRQLDKQALKRAKLAEVRAHNEAVLRDAAIASTSRSSHVGEDTEIWNGSKSSARIKKQTLPSMLKKKDTAKDRLGQRLLNSRARESTIRQLTESEDANHREAFPNQW